MTQKVYYVLGLGMATESNKGWMGCLGVLAIAGIALYLARAYGIAHRQPELEAPKVDLAVGDTLPEGKSPLTTSNHAFEDLLGVDHMFDAGTFSITVVTTGTTITIFRLDTSTGEVVAQEINHPIESGTVVMEKYHTKKQ